MPSRFEWLSTSTPGILRASGVRGKYRARVTCRLPDGKRRNLTRNASSFAEAKIRLEELRRKMGRVKSGFDDINATPITYGQMLDRWIAAKESQSDVSAARVVHLKSLLKHHYRPVLGHVHLSVLDVQHVYRFKESQEAKTDSPATIAQRLRLLREQLDYAVSRQMIASNPAAKVKGPKVPKKYSEAKPGLLSMRMAAELLLVVPEEFVVMVRFAICTGMRSGEIRALQCRDLDFRSGCISVTRGAKKDGSVGGPKNKGSERIVPFGPEMESWLRIHVQGRQPHETVFFQKNGKRWASDPMSKRIAQWIDAIGVQYKVTVHGLRRTYNDALRKHRISPTVAMGIIGHRTVAMSNHYTVETARDRIATVVQVEREFVAHLLDAANERGEPSWASKYPLSTQLRVVA